MKKITKLLLVFTLLIAVPFANICADDNSLSFEYTVTTEGDNTIFKISDDYASFSPEIELDCTLDNPTIVGPNDVAVGYEFDATNHKITFIADAGGTYTISEFTGSKYLNVATSIPSSTIVKDKDGKAVSGTIKVESVPKAITSTLLEKFNLTSAENVVMLDISLTNNGSAIDSAETSTQLILSSAAPNEGKAHTGNFNTWKYDVYREHNGVVKKIVENLVADADGNISFSSNQFSTFAIVAKEVYVSNNNNGGNTYKAPKTCVE